MMDEKTDQELVDLTPKLLEDFGEVIKELAHRLNEAKREIVRLEKINAEFKSRFEAVRGLFNPIEEEPKKVKSVKAVKKAGKK